MRNYNDIRSRIDAIVTKLNDEAQVLAESDESERSPSFAANRDLLTGGPRSEIGLKKVGFDKCLFADYTG